MVCKDDKVLCCLAERSLIDSLVKTINAATVYCFQSYNSVEWVIENGKTIGGCALFEFDAKYMRAKISIIYFRYIFFNTIYAGVVKGISRIVSLVLNQV